jgi:hypothetical protein
MARKRVIYQSEALFVGPTGSNATVAANNKQLNRVQSANYNFDIARKDVNQYGNLAAIDRIIVEQPKVELDFTYYANSGENEKNIGLALSNGDSSVSALSNILTGKVDTDPVNFYILTSPEGSDANIAGWTQTDGQTIGVGNASITSYQIEASVGNIPTVSVKAEALNMNFVNAISGSENPAINPENGSSLGIGFTLPTPVSGSGYSALRPGDITVTLNNGTIGLVETDLKVQKVSVSLDIKRDPIQKLGSRFAFTREVTYPVVAKMSVDAIIGSAQAATLSNVLSTDNDYTVSMKLNAPGSTSVRALKYTLKKAKLDSEQFSSKIGDNKSVSLTFSTQIGGPNDTAAGLFIDGPSA